MIFIIALCSSIVQFSEIQDYLGSKGLNIQIQGVSLGSRELGQQVPYFLGLKAALKGNRKNTLVLVDPFMDGEKEYILGLTSKDFSMCVWNPVNDKGEDRKIHSLVCIAHEISHMAKLPHTKGCISITDENALACPNIETLGFTVQELKKLKRLS